MQIIYTYMYITVFLITAAQFQVIADDQQVFWLL